MLTWGGRERDGNVLIKLRAVNTVGVSIQVNRGGFTVLPALVQSPSDQEHAFPFLIWHGFSQSSRLSLPFGGINRLVVGIGSAEDMPPNVTRRSLFIPGTETSSARMSDSGSMHDKT